MMTKEELELFYLNRFAETLPGFPSGEVIKTENPDFLICNGEEKIGIELTRLFRKPPSDGASPPRAQEELRERIVTLAKVKCDILGIPPIHASVFFNEFHSFKKTDVEPMAERVVSLIKKLLPDDGCSIEEEYMWTNRDYFPEELAAISIYRINSLTETFISAPSAGFLPHLSGNEVQEEIDKKERKVDGYLESCNKIWLVIASSAEGLSSRVEIAKDALQESYAGSFDRVFFFLWPSTIHELEVTPNRPVDR